MQELALPVFEILSKKYSYAGALTILPDCTWYCVCVCVDTPSTVSSALYIAGRAQRTSTGNTEDNQ